MLTAIHIPDRNNVLAHQLSRGHTPTLTVWSLHPSVAVQYIYTYGPYSVELFASKAEQQLSTLRLLGTRQPSDGTECPITQMAVPRRLRLSLIQSIECGPQELNSRRANG